MQAKRDRSQTSLGGKKARASALDSKRVRSLVSEKSLTCKLQVKSVDSQTLKSWSMDWKFLSRKSASLRQSLRLVESSYCYSPFCALLISIVRVSSLYGEITMVLAAEGFSDFPYIGST